MHAAERARRFNVGDPKAMHFTGHERDYNSGTGAENTDSFHSAARKRRRNGALTDCMFPPRRLGRTTMSWRSRTLVEQQQAPTRPVFASDFVQIRNALADARTQLQIRFNVPTVELGESIVSTLAVKAAHVDNLRRALQ
jgi:hypothetical protein